MFFVYLLPDVAITLDSDIYYYHLLLLFVNHYDMWLVNHHHLISLDLEVPRDLSLVVLNHFRRCFPLWSWNLQPILGTNVPVYYASPFLPYAIPVLLIPGCVRPYVITIGTSGKNPVGSFGKMFNAAIPQICVQSWLKEPWGPRQLDGPDHERTPRSERFNQTIGW